MKNRTPRPRAGTCAPTLALALCAACSAGGSDDPQDGNQGAGGTPGTGALAVEIPADLVVHGPAGGPFQESHASFLLRNVGSEAVQWRAAVDTDWLALPEVEGTLVPGGFHTLAIDVDEATAALLPDGQYSGTVVLREGSVDAPRGTIAVHLVVGASPGIVVVHVPSGYTAEGVEGSVTASPRNYNLANEGEAPVEWSVSSDQPWLVMSSGGGTLAPGDRVGLTVAVHPDVSSEMEPGAYAGELTLRNDSLNALAGVIPAQLSIQPEP